jgi:hypothetical protein
MLIWRFATSQPRYNMTDNNETKTGRDTYRHKLSRRRERKQKRIVLIIFAVFCIVLILSMLLTQALRY